MTTGMCVDYIMDIVPTHRVHKSLKVTNIQI